MNTNQKDHTSDNPSSLSFWQELKRRKVIRVAAVYIVVGWIIIQVAETTFPSFGIPDWAFRFVALVLLLGLPIALILAWALELTPEGIRTTPTVEADKDSVGDQTAVAKSRNRQFYVFGALLPTLIIGALAMFFYGPKINSDAELDRSDARNVVGGETRIAQSIAVMPLVNMSSHEENEFFAGGIHEDVLTNLSRIEDLQVISRTSMLRYAASEMTLREIGNELGVDFIVEGSVRRIGNHVRVTVQLINAHNDLHLWANNYERELVDVFATQSAIAREISDSIHLELQPESVVALQGMPTVSVKAYDLYIKALSSEKTEGETEGSVLRRRAMLEEAVAEDPEFVEAWAVLKRLYDLQLDRLRRRGWYVNEGDDTEQVAADLRAASQRALDKAIALDPDNPETLLSRVVDHNWPKSREEMLKQEVIFDRLVSTYPDFAKGWYHLGHWHSHLRDLPEHDLEASRADAIAAFEEALRLDPFNARMVGAVLNWYRDRGYQDDVTRLSERMNQIIPETTDDRRLARVSWIFKRRQLRSAFHETGDESWIDEFRKALNETIESGDFSSPAFQYLDEAQLHIYTGNKDKLVELSHLSIDLSESEWNPLVFSLLKPLGMQIYADRGNQDAANALAREILAQEEILVEQDLSDCTCYFGSLVHANVILGDIDEAQRWRDTMIEQSYLDTLDTVQTIDVLANADIERAVENAFAELTRNPNWDGFGEMAADYAWHRPFLAHPRVHEFYVNNGKWINYLAARVPEYAKYRRETVE